MRWLRFTGLLLFAIGLVLIVISFFETVFNGEYNFTHNLVVDMIMLAIAGGASFGAGLGLIQKSKSKRTPS
jgi:hypothetical protein